MIKLDLMPRLRDTILQVSNVVPVNIGLMEETPSLTIFNLAGGEEIMYFNGEREKTYNIGLLMRHPSDATCFNELTKIYQHLENLKDLASENDSFEFSAIITANLPNKADTDQKGLSIWTCDFRVKILIYKGVGI